MQKKSGAINILDLKFVGGFTSIGYMIMLHNLPILSVFLCMLQIQYYII